MADPGRLHHGQEALHTLQSVRQPEGAEYPRGGDVAEFSAYDAKIEQFLGVVFASQSTVVSEPLIQVFNVKIEGKDVDDGVYDVYRENWQPFPFKGCRHGNVGGNWKKDEVEVGK